ncbi:uncharacterized protein FA14DRAFT_188488 [Meira miltonrushii]|uniref:MICOS complex subunit n=1 Tax=Meira miltonrushii TaxID=1280837 RepID=A0A316VLN4_9BASI|nr:uncharacterized protein FA14DRAFT_188488 [Meira miltonrushii]PWN38502.1 hypothetical protein FA14DRAFT_188488 [Meira miltonrushii]
MAAQRQAVGLAPKIVAMVTGTTAIAYATSNQRSLRLEGETSSKLPIYSAPPEPVILAEVRGPLEDQVASARRTIMGATHNLRESVQNQVRRWISVEHAVENRISSLIPEDEPITPGILYVGVTTLSAFVFGRYRGITLRLLAPPVALVGSLNYFLPKTAHNIGQYYVELESKHLPPFVQQQRHNFQNALKSTQHAAEEQYSKARQNTGSLVQRGLQSVEQGTGLKVAGSPSTPAQAEPRSRMV